MKAFHKKQIHYSALCLLLMLPACGKKGALIYPDRLIPAAPKNVSAQLSGRDIKLSFVLPSSDMAGQSLSGLSAIRVFRSELADGENPVCLACVSNQPTYKTLYLDHLTDAQRFGSLLVLLDKDIRHGYRYHYSFSAVAGDVAGETSLPVAVTSTAMIPEPPRITARSEPTEIIIDFIANQAGEVNGGKFAGYQLYRAIKGEKQSYLPYSKDLITSGSFVDAMIVRGTRYMYAARSVARAPSGDVLESALSNEIEAHSTEYDD